MYKCICSKTFNRPHYFQAHQIICSDAIQENFIKHYENRTISMFISCFIGLLVVYTCGFIHLYGFIYMTASTAGLLDIFTKTLKLGVIPFAIIDFLKILIIINLDKVFRIKA